MTDSSVFFFSSRRRHTRLVRDWSSDVCSSDLSSLGRANITCNKNGIPFDTEKPTITSGIRLGTPAATTRGFGLNEFKKVGELITKVIVGLSKNPNNNSNIEKEVKVEVIKLCASFPIYNHLNRS